MPAKIAIRKYLCESCATIVILEFIFFLVSGSLKWHFYDNVLLTKQYTYIENTTVFTLPNQKLFICILYQQTLKIYYKNQPNLRQSYDR